MPVVNIFSRTGFGLVVTGIPVAGTVHIGDPVELVPGHVEGKVRGIQRFLRDATSGGTGQCLALNIPELSKSPPSRGQVLCRPGYLKACQTFHLMVHVVPGAQRPLESGEDVKFHTGTSEEPGKLYLLEEESLAEGRKGLASIVLSSPVAAAPGDKFIIRRASPPATVGGGEILVASSTGRGKKKQVLEQLFARQAFLGGADASGPEGSARRLEYFLLHERPVGASLQELARETMLTPEVASECLSVLREAGKVLDLSADLFIHAEGYKACLDTAASRIEEASSAGQSLSLMMRDLRQGLDWPPALWSRIQGDLEARKLVTRRGDQFVLETAVEKLGEEDRVLMDKVLAIYGEAGFQSPRPEEVAERLKIPPAAVERLVGLLCNREKLFRLSKNVYLSYDWLKKAQEIVVALISEKGMLDSGHFKYHLRSTRKYALAVLDFLDARRVTVRNGNIRTLSSEYRRNLL